MFDQETHPCPHLYDDETHIFLSDEVQVYCNDQNVTREISNLRKKDGIRFEPITELMIEVISYPENNSVHKKTVEKILQRFKYDHDKNQSDR